MIVNNFYIFICILLLLSEIADVFVGFEIILILKSLCGLSIFFSTFFISRIRELIVPFVLVALSLIIDFEHIKDFNFTAFWIGFREMQPMIAIVLVIPLVSTVLKQEAYLESIVFYGAKWIKTSVHFHFWLLIFTQSVSFFLLPTTVPVVYQFINKFFGGDEKWELIKTTAIYRSIALAGMWVFSFPSFAYAVEALQVPLLMAMLHGLILSLVGIILSLFFIVKYARKVGVSFDAISFQERMKNEYQDSLKIKKNVQEFLYLFMSLLISILLLNYFLPLSLLNIIPLVTIVWT